MAIEITRYSDYTINSIEYFITKIKEELLKRDISGLSNGYADIIPVTKQHPLVACIAKTLNTTDRNIAYDYSGIIPSISVTPGAQPENKESMTHGHSLKQVNINDDFINRLKELRSLTLKKIQEDVLITYNQIDLILSAYKKISSSNRMYYEKSQWHKDEEINISVWSDNADIDILIGNIIDSCLAYTRSSINDNSSIRNLKIIPTKGLTNFQYGRVLYGTEYSLTFLNTYSNYIIYTDTAINDLDFIGTYTVTGEEDGTQYSEE